MFGRYMWGMNNPEMLWWLTPVIVLDLVLKGFALWRAGRNGQKGWFIALLLINSAGILPGIYLLTNKEVKTSKSSKAKKK